MHTADSEFAYVRAVVGFKFLVFYLSEIPFGSKFCSMAYSAVPLLRYFGKDGGGSSEFYKNIYSIFQELVPALGWEREYSQPLSSVAFHYVNFLIFSEIKSRGIPQGLSLIFGNCLLDKDDNLIVDQTRIESVLDKLISEFKEYSLGFPKYAGFFERNDVVALFKQKVNDILDLIAKNQKYPEKFGDARVASLSEGLESHKVPPVLEQLSQIPVVEKNSMKEPSVSPDVKPSTTLSPPFVDEGPVIQSRETPYTPPKSPMAGSESHEEPPTGFGSANLPTKPLDIPKTELDQKGSQKIPDTDGDNSGTSLLDAGDTKSKQTNGPERTDQDSPSLKSVGSNGTGGNELIFILVPIFVVLAVVGAAYAAYYIKAQSKRQTTSLSA